MQYLDEISCVVIGLASADTRHLQQSLHRIWPLLGHAEQGGIGENDEGGHTIRLRSFAAPFAQPLDQGRVNPDLASNVVAEFAIPGSRQRPPQTEHTATVARRLRWRGGLVDAFPVPGNPRRKREIP